MTFGCVCTTMLTDARAGNRKPAYSWKRRLPTTSISTKALWSVTAGGTSRPDSALAAGLYSSIMAGPTASQSSDTVVSDLTRAADWILSGHFPEKTA